MMNLQRGMGFYSFPDNISMCLYLAYMYLVIPEISYIFFKKTHLLYNVKKWKIIFSFLENS